MDLNPIELTKNFPPSDYQLWETQVRRELKGKKGPEDLYPELEEHLQVAAYETENSFQLPEEIRTQAIPPGTVAGLLLPQHPYLQSDFIPQIEWLHTRGGLETLVVACRELPEDETFQLRTLYSGKAPGTSIAMRYTHFDPLAHLLWTGEPTEDAQGTPATTPLGLTTALFLGDTAATATEELALSASNLLDQVQAASPPSGDAPIVSCWLATDSHYLLSVAKFRAFRMLWSTIAEQQDLPAYTHTPVVSALPPLATNAKKAIYSNLVRKSIEAASAVFGGADEVLMPTFRSHLADNPVFAARMSLNLLHLLRHETMAERVNDPFGGSYTLESITQQLFKAAYQLFTEVREAGSTLQWIQNQDYLVDLNSRTQALQKEIQEGEKVVIGQNTFVREDQPADLTPVERPYYLPAPLDERNALQWYSYGLTD